jgi:hypothetical protein
MVLMQCFLPHQWTFEFHKSEHPAAQYYFSWCYHSPNISHFTVPPIRPWQLSIKAKNDEKDHHIQTVPRTDTNLCHRHVTYNMAKSIQISRVTSSANMNHLTRVSAVNHKQLSNDIIYPKFLLYLEVGSVKTEPQWPKYPNPGVRSFVTSKKLILEF